MPYDRESSDAWLASTRSVGPPPLRHRLWRLTQLVAAVVIAATLWIYFVPRDFASFTAVVVEETYRGEVASFVAEETDNVTYSYASAACAQALETGWLPLTLAAINDFNQSSRYGERDAKRVVVVLGSDANCIDLNVAAIQLERALAASRNPPELRFLIDGDSTMFAAIDMIGDRSTDVLVETFVRQFMNEQIASTIRSTWTPRVLVDDVSEDTVRGIVANVEPEEFRIAAYVHIPTDRAGPIGCHARGWYGPKPSGLTNEIERGGGYSVRYAVEPDSTTRLTCDFLADRLVIGAIPTDFRPPLLEDELANERLPEDLLTSLGGTEEEVELPHPEVPNWWPTGSN